MLLLLLAVVTGFIWWFATPPLMRARAEFDRLFLAYSRTERLEQRVQVLTETRADLVDHSAAELRRLERDLHDGAQARLVALSMSLGMADAAFDTDDPEQARQLVKDARSTTAAAIGDLRSVVRGIHPPVLADRGLAGARRGPRDRHGDPGRGRRPPRGPTARAGRVGRLLRRRRVPGQRRQALRAPPTAGSRSPTRTACCARSSATTGAAAPIPPSGTGMLGVMRRLAAFDGTMSVSSPAGGPTIVTLEVPCDLSSPKTTPSSGPA